MNEYGSPDWWKPPEAQNHAKPMHSSDPPVDPVPIILPGEIVYDGGHHDEIDDVKVVYIGGWVSKEVNDTAGSDIEPVVPDGKKSMDDEVGGDDRDVNSAHETAAAPDIKMGFDVSGFDERPPNPDEAGEAMEVHQWAVTTVLRQNKDYIDPVGQYVGEERVYLEYGDSSGQLYASVSSSGEVRADYQHFDGGVSYGTYTQEDGGVVHDNANPDVAFELLPPPGALPQRVAEQARTRVAKDYAARNAELRHEEKALGVNLTPVGPEHMKYVGDTLRRAVPLRVPFETVDNISRARTDATSTPTHSDAMDAGQLATSRLYKYLENKGYKYQENKPVETHVGDVVDGTLIVEVGERSLGGKHPYVQMRLLKQIDPVAEWDRLKRDYGADIKISDEPCWEETILDYATPGQKLIHSRRTHLYAPGLGFTCVAEKVSTPVYCDRLEVGQLTYFLREPTIRRSHAAVSSSTR